MNRLVIVGNGFDRAHGLASSYSDFMDNYWSNLRQRYEKKPYMNITYVNPEFYRVLSINQILNFDGLIKNLEEYCQEYGYFFDKKNLIARDKKTSGFKEIFKFKNHFFKLLNQKRSVNQWVDIETEYYSELKRICKRDDFDSQRKKEEVETLNEEFVEIRELLVDYIYENVETKISYDFTPDKPFDLYELFKMEYLDLKNNQKSRYLREFRKGDYEHLIEQDEELNRFLNQERDAPIEINLQYVYPPTVFLNFNYTNTLVHYQEEIKNNIFGYAKIIHIHGRLILDNKDVCFGFGDEMDEDYRLIENLGDNEFLNFFKSFFYSQNSCYKDLLDYIDSDKFQVFIMGHSCGLSDRVLLNTIFEHENCRSIKVFYHKKDDGSDNFTEITQNISRHFKENKIMREKLVDKIHSEPLPQNIRFIKKKVTKTKSKKKRSFQ